LKTERASTKPSSNVTVIADGDALIEIAQHATGGGPVNVEDIAIASVGRRDYEGVAVS